jgi:hypothetical protein
MSSTWSGAIPLGLAARYRFTPNVSAGVYFQWNPAFVSKSTCGSIPEAVGLVLVTAAGDYGDLCVLEMGEPVRIVDMANHLITMAGYVPGLEIPVVFTGLRPR